MEAAAAGRTSYGKGAALPCPACGYDLRAAPVSEGWVRCPECGTAYVRGWVAQLDRPEPIASGRIDAMIFGRSLLHAAFFIPIGLTLSIILPATPLTEAARLGLVGTLICIALIFIAFTNRDAAKVLCLRFYYRNRSTPKQLICPVFTIYLILLTAIQFIMVWVYFTVGGLLLTPLLISCNA